MSKFSVTLDGVTYDVDINAPRAAESLTVIVNGVVVPAVVGTAESGRLEWIIVGGRVYDVIIDHDLRWIQSPRNRVPLEIRDREATATRPASGDARVKAPVPGLITRVMVQAGDEVEAGQPLLILEAMKMENEICAPRAGSISRLDVTPGSSVTLNHILVEIT